MKKWEHSKRRARFRGRIQVDKALGVLRVSKGDYGMEMYLSGKQGGIRIHSWYDIDAGREMVSVDFIGIESSQSFHIRTAYKGPMNISKDWKHSFPPQYENQITGTNQHIAL